MIATSSDLRTSAPDAVDQALYRAAARATFAPSIHNTQPWRFVVRTGRLDVYADPSRRAPVIDPSGRQLTISCGAAIFGARMALAAAGWDAVTTLQPDRLDSDHLATITVAGPSRAVDKVAYRLDAAAEDRHSNRRQFSPQLIPADVIDNAMRSAEREGAWLHPVRDLDDRIMVATLTQRAESTQEANAAYRAEVRAWTSDDPSRRDGVPTYAVPSVTGGAHDDIPIRDFDTYSEGALPAETHSSLQQSIFILGTAGDATRDWLVAGQALARVLLELTSAGYVASILSQVTEVPSTREQLRQGLRLTGCLQMLVRSGIAEPTPATPRRLLTDVIK